MRAKIKVVGLGQRMTGTTNKDGKSRNYDFVPVAFIFPDSYFEGFRAATCNVDGPSLDARGPLRVGEEVDAVYHVANRQVYIDAIL